MARMAAGRTTHLTRDEIAQEALRQFDAPPREPSIRSLAAALRVAPMAIYHHFPSQAAVVQAVVDQIWAQSFTNLLQMVPRPLEADPAEVLVAIGVATRRTWIEHHRVGRYMAATPEANDFTSNSLRMFATLFEKLGLEGEQAAAAFHAYATFTLGSTMYATARLDADTRLSTGASTPHADRRYHPRRDTPQTAGLSIEQIPDLSVVDPAHDDQLYEQGLRHLINSYIPPRRRHAKPARKQTANTNEPK